MMKRPLSPKAIINKSPPQPTFSLSQRGILQRTCDCGEIAGLTGECEACRRQRLIGQQEADSLSSSSQETEGGYHFEDIAINPQSLEKVDNPPKRLTKSNKRTSQNIPDIMREVRGMVRPEEIESLRRNREQPSSIIPDLDESVVSDISSRLPLTRSPQGRQEIIDSMVENRRQKGTDFSIMQGEKPHYVSAFPTELLNHPERPLSPHANGVTVAPHSPSVNESNKPLVFIGPAAFGQARDPVNEILVRLYTTIMHEYQHTLQRSRAVTMSHHQREVDAFFWEIENSQQTGLFQQRIPFQHTWDEALQHWQAFVNSPEWNTLSFFERAEYARRYQRVSDIVIEVLHSE